VLRSERLQNHHVPSEEKIMIEQPAQSANETVVAQSTKVTVVRAPAPEAAPASAPKPAPKPVKAKSNGAEKAVPVPAPASGPAPVAQAAPKKKKAKKTVKKVKTVKVAKATPVKAKPVKKTKPVKKVRAVRASKPVERVGRGRTKTNITAGQVQLSKQEVVVLIALEKSDGAANARTLAEACLKAAGHRDVKLGENIQTDRNVIRSVRNALRKLAAENLASNSQRGQWKIGARGKSVLDKYVNTRTKTCEVFKSIQK